MVGSHFPGPTSRRGSQSTTSPLDCPPCRVQWDLVFFAATVPRCSIRRISKCAYSVPRCSASFSFKRAKWLESGGVGKHFKNKRKCTSCFQNVRRYARAPFFIKKCSAKHWDSVFQQKTIFLIWEYLWYFSLLIFTDSSNVHDR